MFVTWLVKSLPALLTSDPRRLRGRRSSERYWRARLAEALEHYNEALPDSEKSELVSRIADARVMVEAHEAKRRLALASV